MPFPRFSYCKRQKLGMEAWERGYDLSTLSFVGDEVKSSAN